MVYRTRIKYTAAQKADIWDRWQRGESLNSIGRLFDRPSSSVFTMLAPTAAQKAEMWDRWQRGESLNAYYFRPPHPGEVSKFLTNT